MQSKYAVSKDIPVQHIQTVRIFQYKISNHLLAPRSFVGAATAREVIVLSPVRSPTPVHDRAHALCKMNEGRKDGKGRDAKDGRKDDKGRKPNK